MQTRGAAFQPGHLIARSCANKAASSCSPDSLPPPLPPLPSISTYMTSSLGRSEVLQAVQLTICSRSPVSHVISVHITKALFMSQWNVHLSHSYVFLPSVSKLTVFLFSWTSWILFMCLLFSATHAFECVLKPVSAKFDRFPLLPLVSLSLFFLSQFFFLLFSTSICHVCVSVPVLLLLSVPKGSLTQRRQSLLLHQLFC